MIGFDRLLPFAITVVREKEKPGGEYEGQSGNFSPLQFFLNLPAMSKWIFKHSLPVAIFIVGGR